MIKPQSREQVDALSELEWETLGEAIADHLCKELALLEKVIGCSQRMQDLLQRSAIPVRFTSQSVHSQQTGQENGLQGIHQIRNELSDEFDSISDQRVQFFQMIKDLSRESGPTPTLAQLVPRLPQKLRNQLTLLRTEIKSKLQEIQSMTMANQTVLMYTLDFYQRLISGLSADEYQQPAYDASGKIASKNDLYTLLKRC